MSGEKPEGRNIIASSEGPNDTESKRSLELAMQSLFLDSGALVENLAVIDELKRVKKELLEKAFETLSDMIESSFKDYTDDDWQKMSPAEREGTLKRVLSTMVDVDKEIEETVLGQFPE